MFRHRLNAATSWRVHFDWYLLSFIAGCVNAGGYLGAHRFVSHVTGFATLFGVKGASGEWDQAIGILSVPVFFLLGVMVATYLVDRRVNRSHRPHYAAVMSLVCFCLLAAALGGFFSFFGDFGSEPSLHKDYFFLALLCAASGLQNAAISTASGATVRTTHLTGITTDLGIGLVRAFSNRKLFSSEMRAARVRMGTVVSFAGGSALGAYSYMKFQYLGFLLPAGLAAYSVFEALRGHRRLFRQRRNRMKLSP
jgi:uncharacterized membrane protein YoaK (UPF0700 family)